MAKLLNDKELQAKMRADELKGLTEIDRLSRRIQKEKFSYEDAIRRKLDKARDRSLALLLIGAGILIAALIFSDIFPQYDEPAYFFLEGSISINPILGFIGMVLPPAVVFAFLVWLHNRETKFWFYLTKKAQETKRKSSFLITLIEPFLMLVSGIALSILLLLVASLFGCEYFFCRFYETAFYFSSNILFNFLSLSFYLMILGGVQLKRYLDLVRFGVKNIFVRSEE